MRAVLALVAGTMLIEPSQADKDVPGMDLNGMEVLA